MLFKEGALCGVLIFLELCMMKDGQETCAWIPDSKWVFSVKSFYSMQIGGSCQPVNEGYLWKIPAPPWVSSFSWVAHMHKVLTLNKLQRQLANGWILCLRDVKDVNHLFIYCSFTSKGWHVVFQLFGVNWVMPGTVKNLLDQWRYVFHYYEGRWSRNWL